MNVHRQFMAAVATGVVAACVAGYLFSPPAPLADPEPRSAGAGTAGHAPRPSWLRPVPPALVLPAGDEIDQALRPWQAGNYAGAAMWLEALAATQPGTPVLHFYAGAGWLLAGVPADAVAALEHAIARVPVERRGETAWYLGLARLDLGQARAARLAFDDACRHGVSLGCQAAAYLAKAADAPRTSLAQKERLR